MAKGKMGGGSIVATNRMKSVVAQAKGNKASINPAPVMPLGPTPSGPAKSAPKSSATSAIAPKVQGSPGAAAKNPMYNGSGVKLGNHC